MTWINRFLYKRSTGHTSVTQLEHDIDRLKGELEGAVHKDHLTGLGNRNALDRAFRERHVGIHDSLRGQDALLFMDMDNFKYVNDAFGHDVGDLLICELSKLLVDASGGSSVCRIGGDEFVILFSGVTAWEDACLAAERVMTVLGVPRLVGSVTLRPKGSIGLCRLDHRNSSVSELLRRADLALRFAKQHGKSQIVEFTGEMENFAAERLHIEGIIEDAFKNGEFWVAVQPIVDLHSGEVKAGELLLRWTSADGTAISPAKFIPIAEDNGLILKLGEKVLQEAIDRLSEWKSDKTLSGVRLSVNVSGCQLAQSNFTNSVVEKIENSRILPSQLVLEVTESLIVQDVETVRRRLEVVRAMGVSVAIDDFGTGYSSLSMLMNLPFNYLKIDRAFVSGIERNVKSEKLITTLMGLGNSLGLTIVAEGIETDFQTDFMKAKGCRYGQGFWFSKPMPMEEFEEFARNSVLKNCHAA